MHTHTLQHTQWSAHKHTRMHTCVRVHTVHRHRPSISRDAQPHKSLMWWVFFWFIFLATSCVFFNCRILSSWIFSRFLPSIFPHCLITGWCLLIFLWHVFVIWYWQIDHKLIKGQQYQHVLAFWQGQYRREYFQYCFKNLTYVCDVLIAVWFFCLDWCHCDVFIIWLV